MSVVHAVLGVAFLLRLTAARLPVA